eukprot:COSAG02_NODE_53983_length_298_cov_1.291457_1_plen_52_part_01
MMLMHPWSVIVCLLLFYGPTACESQPAAPGCEADVTGDGRVNVADILDTLSA